MTDRNAAIAHWTAIEGPDGALYRLGPGDGVGFPPVTGLAHSFLNTTDHEVRLLVVGERTRPENLILHPMNSIRARCGATVGGCPGPCARSA